MTRRPHSFRVPATVQAYASPTEGRTRRALRLCAIAVLLFVFGYYAGFAVTHQTECRPATTHGGTP